MTDRRHPPRGSGVRIRSVRSPRVRPRHDTHAPENLERRLDELLLQIAAEAEGDLDRSPPSVLSPSRVEADVDRWLAQRRPRAEVLRVPYSWRPMAAAWRPVAAASLALSLSAIFSLRSHLGPPSSQLAELPRSAYSARAGLDTLRSSSLPTGPESSESWYLQVARAPSTSLQQRTRFTAAECSTDSWYCVQARPELTRGDL